MGGSLISQNDSNVVVIGIVVVVVVVVVGVVADCGRG